MSDEVDDLLRRAMTTLDDQIPAGTFDTLADRTLARLDDPAFAEADELARERATRAAHANRAMDQARPAAAADPVTTTAAAAAERTRSTGGPRLTLIGLIGVGVAAAAGVMLFVSTRDETGSADKRAIESSPAAGELMLSGSASPTARAQIAAAKPDAAPPTPSPSIASGSGSSAEGRDRKAKGAGAPPLSKAAPNRANPITAFQSTSDSAKPDEPAQRKRKTAGSVKGNVSPSKLEATLDRTSLSADDITRGMTAVAGDARACSAGTGGVASLAVAVLPSGKVAEAVVSGPFAGTPVGRCVERAVRSATFPPWDGVLQRFEYRYQLSE